MGLMANNNLMILCQPHTKQSALTGDKPTTGCGDTVMSQFALPPLALHWFLQKVCSLRKGIVK